MLTSAGQFLDFLNALLLSSLLARKLRRNIEMKNNTEKYGNRCADRFTQYDNYIIPSICTGIDNVIWILCYTLNRINRLNEAFVGETKKCDNQRYSTQSNKQKSVFQ